MLTVAAEAAERGGHWQILFVSDPGAVDDVVMGKGNHSTAEQGDENDECEKKFHKRARKLMRNAPARQSAQQDKIRPPATTRAGCFAG